MLKTPVFPGASLIFIYCSIWDNELVCKEHTLGRMFEKRKECYSGRGRLLFTAIRLRWPTDLETAEKRNLRA